MDFLDRYINVCIAGFPIAYDLFVEAMRIAVTIVLAPFILVAGFPFWLIGRSVPLKPSSHEIAPDTVDSPSLLRSDGYIEQGTGADIPEWCMFILDGGGKWAQSQVVLEGGIYRKIIYMQHPDYGQRCLRITSMCKEDLDEHPEILRPGLPHE